ncbi:MAG: class I SAM-dependent methyltransferase, partial [Planctomycetota bacterium]|nr:class I SAM-dependent methyltransferase [Planctomycetota bacterium]
EPFGQSVRLPTSTGHPMYDQTYDRLIAEHYDGTYDAQRTPSGDIDFYADLAAQSGGPLLELGCGTGRVLLPIAATGIECTGLDASPAMLAVLRSKNPPSNLTLHHSTFESFSLERQFALITCPFRAFQHLITIEAQLSCLASIRAHLAPGGLFAFDVFDPDPAHMAARTTPESLDATFSDGPDQIQRFNSVTRNHSTQTLEVLFRFERTRDGQLLDSSTHTIAMRWFYRFELEHLLARAGFKLEARYGSFDKQPQEAGREIIMVAS